MSTDSKISCDHCGEECEDEVLVWDQKNFCCTGCQTVYEILSANDLCDYYEIDQPNIQVKTTNFGSKYAFLDNSEIEQQLYQFSDGDYRIVKFFVPIIHCASCIWLLEHLSRINPAIASSKVNFIKKEVTINFNRSEISLRQIVELIASIGYPPDINLQGHKEEVNKKRSRNLLIKLGVAGFCFGNIMLMSFPEYLSFQFQDEAFYIQVFAWLNLALSIPLVFYCATEYFVSAFKGLRSANINLDVPISLGISVLFLRSSFDIISQTGPGYLDSLAGLIFFLLIGKWFQNKTYRALSFDRDYKSYFPLGVTLIEKGVERGILASQLRKGDEILIRNQELIPADAILVSNGANIDYSFVTGESVEVSKQKGDFLYAGGRQIGSSIQVVVQKEVSQSYLTDLWNQNVFRKDSHLNFTSLVDQISRHFTLVIIAIAILTGVYWYFIDSSIAIEAVTAVLIIACPCALALSMPFTMGNALRVFGRNGFYAKNSNTIENLAKINSVVFDKTGTLTSHQNNQVVFHGLNRLTSAQNAMVKVLCSSSTHPISQAIASSLKTTREELPDQINFKEVEGSGISSIINGLEVKIGSGLFCNTKERISGSHAFLAIDDEVKGYFKITKSVRAGVLDTLKSLYKEKYGLHLLSGDSQLNQTELNESPIEEQNMHFQQSPQEKLDYLETLKQKDNKVLMVGDGLNDSGALKAADVGIAISEDVYSFSPACDGILDANKFTSIPHILRFSKLSIRIVKWSFVLSFLYNVIGLSFAVQGLLTPVIAAILMPLSSITVVVFVTLATNLLGSKTFRRA